MKSDDPLGYLENLSDGATALVLSVVDKLSDKDAELIKSRVLKTVQQTLDQVAGTMASLKKRSKLRAHHRFICTRQSLVMRLSALPMRYVNSSSSSESRKHYLTGPNGNWQAGGSAKPHAIVLMPKQSRLRKR